MSLPACFPLVNTSIFSNIELEISASETPEALQTLVNKVFNELSIIESTLTSQLAFLDPINALVTPPGANLSEIVTWISSLITDFITPMIKPLVTMAAQLAALPAYITEITAAIESAAAAKFPGISITIPPITIGCSL